MLQQILVLINGLTMIHIGGPNGLFLVPFLYVPLPPILSVTAVCWVKAEPLGLLGSWPSSTVMGPPEAIKVDTYMHKDDSGLEGH